MKSNYTMMCVLVLYKVIVHNTEASSNNTCETPASISNGDVALHVNDPSLAVYSCHPGYILTGNEYRRCESNGKWKGNVPHCSFEEQESPTNIGLILGPTFGGIAVFGLGIVIYRYLRKKGAEMDDNGDPTTHLVCNCCAHYEHNPQTDNRRVINNDTGGAGLTILPPQPYGKDQPLAITECGETI